MMAQITEPHLDYSIGTPTKEYPCSMQSALSQEYTVKPVFKGHCDEGTPCDQGTLSQNSVLSSP